MTSPSTIEQLRRGSPTIPRKAAMSTELMSMDSQVPKRVVEFQDPAKVRLAETCKYSLFFISIGLFISTIVMMTVLLLEMDFGSDELYNIKRLPNLDEICRFYDHGGVCLSNHVVTFTCESFACTSHTIDLRVSEGTLLHNYSSIKLDLHVPNGHVCGESSWCIGGVCVPSSHPDVPKTYETLSKIRIEGQEKWDYRCLRMADTALRKLVHYQLRELHPKKKFCNAEKVDIRSLPLPSLDAFSCTGAVPKVASGTVPYCKMTPLRWNRKSYEKCKKYYFYNRTDIRKLPSVRPHGKIPCKDTKERMLPNGFHCSFFDVEGDVYVHGLCLNGVCIPIEKEEAELV